MAFEDQLKRVLEAAIAELTALAAIEHDDARKEGLEKGRALGWEDGREQGRFEARQAAEEEARAAVEAAVAAARREVVADQAATERLVDAVRAIDRGRTLSEVLDTLVACAARETARAGVLLVRGGRIQPFRFVGIEAIPADLPLDDGSVVSAAVRTRTIATGESDGDVNAPAFATLEPNHACLAVPIVLAGDAVAVLYADDQGEKPRGETKWWPEALEVLARHAAKCLEALTAIKAARLVAGAPAERANGSPADGEDPDTAAKRYARLLVSEIKLYHEPDVAAGQRDRDLASRLGGEIARARVLYEQRVPAAVRERSDYFRDELVRTLANGDPTLLQLT
jgi:hypothetical protein